MTIQDRLRRFPRRFLPTLLMFLLLAAAFGVYVRSEKHIDRANETRHRSLLLAGQLRQTSDDLTRMARTYVVTGDPLFKRHYQNVLDIRDGRKPRPEGYFHSYWDLVLANPESRRPNGGAAIPLLDLMREAGFTDDELGLLARAKATSDELTATEFAAMKLMETSGPNREADRSRARLMLHDGPYHQAKAAIMRPINEVFVSMERRTAETVRVAERDALILRMVFVAFALTAMLMLWRTFAVLRKTLGGSADEVHARITRIGRGDFSSAATAGHEARGSVLAGLTEMQARLHALEVERERVTESLRVSTERLNEAQQIAHVGSWALDLTSNELVWSEEIYRLFEIDPKQFGATYEAFLEAIHPEDREAVNQAYIESLKTRAPYEITHRLRMPDGRIKWVHERGTSDFDAAGKPLRSRGTVQDVTERKLAEEQLRIAAAAFDSQEGMMITDADGTILRVNRTFCEITGYRPDEVVGKTPRLLQSGRHDEEFYRAMWETIDRTGTWQGEVWDRRKNGEVYPKWLTISAVKDDHGAVTHYVGTHFDITERKQAEEKINELAFFDQLTGLPNRTLLHDRLKQTMTASARSGSYGALLFIDLDNFKTLNDTLGHDMGDLLLRQVAQRLTSCVRAGDTVARQGGDEFVVMLASLSLIETDAARQTESVGEKILAALNEVHQLRDATWRSSASIGATLFRGHLATIDDLMKQVDLAMYKSKATGRNALRFFDPEMETAVMARAALEAGLRQAIDGGELELHYQAQVTLDGRVTGAEALVRWRHPQRGMVSPGEFIPLAEETGLVVPLGNWVLRTACRQLNDWASHVELAGLSLAVNVSVKQFREPGFVAEVMAILGETGADPNRLKLELTESLLAENVQDIIEKMYALKARGVSFSLDDFGTGYSSLAYLKRLPLDQLKIDQSFVRDVLSDPNDAAIARTVVALAHSLGLGVIAEGVETEAQRAFLENAGCHAYQGYLFSRPLPVAGFEEFARRV